MPKDTDQIKFAQVTPNVVKHFLSTALQRIIVAKAGYSEDEIEQLISLVKERDVICNLYFEQGEKPIRYGFGSKGALRLIHENIDILNVQSVNQIRMALIIVDDAALVYAPTALSWEESPKELEFPNGFFGATLVAETLFKQMGGEVVTLDMEQEVAESAIEKPVISISVPPIPKKSPEKVQKELEQTEKALEENPPVDPAKLRNTTFYRNRYKLLKMIIHGAKVKK